MNRVNQYHSQKGMIRGLSVLILLCYSFLLTTCENEPVPHAHMKAGDRVVLSIDHAMSLSGLYVCCSQELVPHDENYYVWQIERDWHKKLSVDKLDIEYGVTPEIFTQRIPENAKNPPSLVEGSTYYYSLTGSSGGGSGCFQVKGNGAVAVNCDGLDSNIQVATRGEELPVFTVTGSDKLFDIVVAYEDRSAPDIGGWTLEYVWEARPDDEHKKQLPIEITYGILPEGYNQIEPSKGRKPPTLKSGVTYQFRAKGIWSSERVCFQVKDKKTVIVKCEMGWAG